MGEWSKGEKWGLGIGIGAAVAALAGIGIVVAKKSRGPSDLDVGDAHLTGVIPGYDTQPGDSYIVYQAQDNEVVPVLEAMSVWFQGKAEESRFGYDLCRRVGQMPPGGALLALGHHFKAGGHFIREDGSHTQAAMRGMNLWGVKAGDQWVNAGNLFWLAPTKEYLAGKGRVAVKNAAWRFFDSPDESMRRWLDYTMGGYPAAKAELFRKQPDPYRYAWNLTRWRSSHGYPYATGLDDAPGPWGFGADMATQMKAVAELLEDEYGYDGLRSIVDEIPILNKAQQMGYWTAYPDFDNDYPLEGYP